MSKSIPVIGVSTVTLGAPDPSASALPSLNSLVFSASATEATIVNNEVRSALQTSTNYQVALAFWGYDITNGGYTIGTSSAGSGTVSLTASTQGIRILVPNANWPAGTFTSTDHRLVAVFLRQGTGNFQLCDVAYVDPNNDFDFMVAAKPFNTPTRSLAFLQNASTDSIFGSRAPYPGAETSVGVTSGGVTLDFTAAQAQVSPDTSPDYQIATSRGCNVTFASLQNNAIDIVKATAGIYVQFTGASGATIRLAQQTMLTASAALKGNAHIVIDEPVDQNGVSNTRIILGNLTVSQVQNTFSRTKTAPALLNYNLQTAAIDTLLQNMDSQIVYGRQA